MAPDKVNILLVDDQPAKLLSYEAILEELGETLFKANSAKQALEILLKHEIAVILVDVFMPDLDGFELARMIRDHPRFKNTAIIFISAVLLADMDRVRGYELGAVDYVPVPVIPEVLRAKVRVFAELYRKTRELELLNKELEQRVAERTLELERYTSRLMESERRRSLALAAGQMGSWECDIQKVAWWWDEGQYRIFGVEPGTFSPSTESILELVHPEDRPAYRRALEQISGEIRTAQIEFRVCRPGGELRWCIVTAASTIEEKGQLRRVSGVTVDITDRKKAEEHERMLAREVDHRARNALAVVQSIVKLTRAESQESYVAAVQGRIAALARTHAILSESRWLGAELTYLLREELSPYSAEVQARVSLSGTTVSLRPAIAQSIALVIHELATNAAKYGSLKSPHGAISLAWGVSDGMLELHWVETGGPECAAPAVLGFGSKMIKATIEKQLNGSCTFDWAPMGLRFTLQVALEESRTPEASSAANVVRHEARSDARRILLVEDEATVALMMAEYVAGLGFAVVGPYASLPEAVMAVHAHSLSAAILDINLNGEMAFPIAEALEARDVPFMFVSGYSVDNLDRRFAHVPVLRKPVDWESLRQQLLAIMEQQPQRSRAFVSSL